MKRMLVVALLALALPRAAWAAQDISIMNAAVFRFLTRASNPRGRKWSTASGLFHLSTIRSAPSVSRPGRPSGSLETGGKFSPICSSFVVIGRGNYGEPKGVIFSGNFFGPIKWTLISKTGAVLIFKLTGNIEGIFFNGRMIRASARQTIVTTEEQLAKGIGHIASDRVLVTP